MNISGISNYNLKNLSFGRNGRMVYDNNNKFKYVTYTEFFRDDLNWKNLICFFDKRFKSENKVHVYDFACSDGAETHSIAGAFKEFSKTPDKFLPVTASDIDEENIKTAKNGLYDINSYDIYAIAYWAKSNYERYFHVDEENMQCSPDKSSVVFSCENIKDGLDNVKRGNKIILCRNFWQYLNNQDREIIASKLAAAVNKKSVVVIGAYDEEICAGNILREKGFRNIKHLYDNNREYIFEKA